MQTGPQPVCCLLVARLTIVWWGFEGRSVARQTAGSFIATWCTIVQLPILFVLTIFLDTDVMIWEGSLAGMSLFSLFSSSLNSLASPDPLGQPPEIHSVMENFRLGTYRLEIFGQIGRAHV